MDFKTDKDKTPSFENGSSFKGRKRLFKTLSLFSSTQTPTDQGNQKTCTSSSSFKSTIPRHEVDVKRSLGTTPCQDVQNRQGTNPEKISCLG